jgi:hypothetical protein
MTISEDTRLRAPAKLPGRSLAGETVVIDPRRRRVFLMNSVGGMVWAGVERQASIREIVGEVVQRFRVTEAEARVDIERFAGELLSSGLAETF